MFRNRANKLNICIKLPLTVRYQFISPELENVFYISFFNAFPIFSPRIEFLKGFSVKWKLDLIHGRGGGYEPCAYLLFSRPPQHFDPLRGLLHIDILAVVLLMLAWSQSTVGDIDSHSLLVVGSAAAFEIQHILVCIVAIVRRVLFRRQLLLSDAALFQFGIVLLVPAGLAGPPVAAGTALVLGCCCRCQLLLLVAVAVIVLVVGLNQFARSMAMLAACAAGCC